MGPDGLTAVAAALDAQRQALDREASRYRVDYPDVAEQQQTQATYVLSAVGNTFATATRGSSQDQLSRDFAATLAQVLPFNGFGLSELLRFGTYDPAFLATIGGAVIRYDEVHDDSPAYWPGRSSVDRITPWTSPDDRAFYDPVVGLMTAAAHNPFAAQTLLSDPGTLHYLSTRHGYADGGDAFGAALEAATATYRDNLSPTSAGYRSAAIASAALHDLAGKDGQIPDGLRTHVGRMLASYIPDVDAAAINGSDTGPGVRTVGYSGMPSVAEYGAVFSLPDLRKVMTRVFSDDDAFQSVSAAALAYAQSYFETTASTIASSGDDHDLTSFDAAAAHAAALFGLVTDSGNIASINTARDHDANRQSWLDLGRSSLDLIDVPGGKLVALGVEELKDQLFGQFVEDTAGGAVIQADSTSAASRVMVINLAAAAMARHGLFGGPTAPTNPLNYRPSGPVQTDIDAWRFTQPDGSLVRSTDLTTTRYQAYQDWLYGPTSGFSGVQTTIEADFSALQEQYGAR